MDEILKQQNGKYQMIFSRSKTLHRTRLKANFSCSVSEGILKIQPGTFFCHHLSSTVEELFDEISHRGNLHLPSSPVKANTTTHGGMYKALDSFSQLVASGSNPTKFALCTALKSCTRIQNWQLGVQIHGRIVQAGYDQNLFLSSALIDFYAKCGVIRNARKVFASMERHDHVSWTSIIYGLLQNGNAEESIFMFKEMLKSDVTPNSYTYVSVISASTELEEPILLSSLLHSLVIKLGFGVSSFVISALVDCYSKCGKIGQAKLLFEETTERDCILLNSMIAGLSQNMCAEVALELFVEMGKANLTPTDHTLTSILNACGALSIIQQGKKLHSLVIKKGSENNLFVVSALIDMYSKCGCIDEAGYVFNQTSQRNTVLWTSMLMGYAQSGRGLDALGLFESFLTEGYTPDKVSFTAALTACNHSGFLDKGIEYFNMMRKYGLVPEVDQYACLVDLYARKGYLRKAKELMEEMPYDPNSVMLSSFLSFCKLYGEVELARETGMKLFKMEPLNAATYLNLASTYVNTGSSSEATEIRKLIHEMGIKKSAGWSWVEVDRDIHVFAVQDDTHLRSKDIYAALGKLDNEIKEAGFMSTYSILLETS